MPSPVLILRDATVWASASSSCARRSEFRDTASMWLPLPVAGPAFPFLRTGPNEGEINAAYPGNNRHGIAPPRNTLARSTGGNKMRDNPQFASNGAAKRCAIRGGQFGL